MDFDCLWMIRSGLEFLNGLSLKFFVFNDTRRWSFGLHMYANERSNVAFPVLLLMIRVEVWF